jgi:hypothetical protein
LLKDWGAYLIKDNALNDPLVDLRYALSKPCGNLANKYSQRTVPISPIYSSYYDTCTYDDETTKKEHSLFSLTTFSDVELNVYI